MAPRLMTTGRRRAPGAAAVAAITFYSLLLPAPSRAEKDTDSWLARDAMAAHRKTLDGDEPTDEEEMQAEAEMEPEAEEVMGGDDEAAIPSPAVGEAADPAAEGTAVATSADMSGSKGAEEPTSNDEALVVVMDADSVSSADAVDNNGQAKEEDGLLDPHDPNRDPAMDSEDEPVVDAAAPANANTEESSSTQSVETAAATETPSEPTEPVTMTPTEPTTTEPVQPTPAPTPSLTVSNKPALRSQAPTLSDETDTLDDAAVATGTASPGSLVQGGSPMVLVALGVICCLLLLLWGRKRRFASASTGSSSGTGAKKTAKGSKVEYSQVPAEHEHEHESPFGRHNQDDDLEYCDEYEEDSFANDRDNWDDWEGSEAAGGSSPAAQTQLNPFIVTPSAPPSAPTRQTSSSSAFKINPPPQHAQLQDVGGSAAHVTSVGSNSSSDSFEVVTEETAMSHDAPSAASSGAETDKEGVDDLFSQFGMVPTFKKGVTPPSAPVSTSGPRARASPSSTPASGGSLPTAASASALFAAELDDELTNVDAADDWGEDDEWVKGI